MNLRIAPPPREQDSWGAGYFGAPRASGARTHNGQDYACYPGSVVFPATAGVVSKVGYPYRDDLSFRYVEITDDLGYRVRYFYVDPVVELWDNVDHDTPLGVVQTLDNRYPGITEHIHIEVFTPDGTRIDPEEYL